MAGLGKPLIVDHQPTCAREKKNEDPHLEVIVGGR